MHLLQENEKYLRISAFQNFIKNNQNFSLVSVNLPLDYTDQKETINEIVARNSQNKSLSSVAYLEERVFQKLLDNKTNYGNKFFVVIEDFFYKSSGRKILFFKTLIDRIKFKTKRNKE